MAIVKKDGVHVSHPHYETGPLGMTKDGSRSELVDSRKMVVIEGQIYAGCGGCYQKHPKDRFNG
jgi:hypothetical protein